ncbi:50S ribosomal protein L24 [Candidatus Babeliales bacterium]|nr:50S ribosomal protein L24 [Candidatus Babeliales bacterium]
MKNQLKKNDKVQVITGKDRGKVGEILELCHKTGKIKVKGINMMIKHVKARKQGDAAGIQKHEAFIHMSNVMPVDSLTSKPVRLNKIKRA